METVQTTSTNTKETEPLTLEDLQSIFSMLPESKEPPYQLVIFACVKHSKELKKRIAESSKDANPLMEPSVMIHVKKYLKKVRLVKVPKPSYFIRPILPNGFDPLSDFMKERDRNAEQKNKLGWYI